MNYLRLMQYVLVALILGTTAKVLADRPPLSGKALTFQGYLVDEKGVPHGTNTPQVFYMRFSITTREGGGSLLWQSGAIGVEVRDGLFTVRLGQFSANDQPIDDSIFTGNDSGDSRRHLMMEISTGGSDGPWLGFFRKDINPGLIDETVVDSHIAIPAMPFTVSAMRVQGRDIKEGGLRISADPDEPPSVQADLDLETASPLQGLHVFHNENIGLLILNPVTAGDEGRVVFKVSAKSTVRGGVFLDGADSRFDLNGDLNATGSGQGILYLAQSDNGPDSDPAMETGEIRAMNYRTASGGYQINLTSTSVFRELIVDDSRRKGLSTITVDSTGNARVLIEDGDLTLEPSANIQMSAFNLGLQTLRFSPKSRGLEVMGFYDREQINPSSAWPYQAIPHGLSVFNTLSFGGSYNLDLSYLQLLIGTASIYGETRRPGNALVPGTIDQPLHRHDLRAGSDADALVDKINASPGPRIIRRRISDDVAWLYEPNTFIYDNYFNYTDGISSPGLLTAGSLVARYETLETYLRADFSGMYLGSRSPGIQNFYFLECADANNCPHPGTILPYLALRFNRSDFSESVEVERNVSVLGDVHLAATYANPAYNNHLQYGIDPLLFGTDTNPLVHSVRGEALVGGDMILYRQPRFNTLLDVSDYITADRLMDSRNPSLYILDPSLNSLIFSLQVDQTVQVNQNLEGWFLNSSPRIEILGSAQLSGTLTASIFRDINSPSQHYIDPNAGVDVTSIRELTLTSDLTLANQASIGGSFLSTSDLTSSQDVIIQTAGFRTGNDLIVNRFIDTNSPAYTLTLDNTNQLNSLLSSGSVTGFTLDSFSATAILSVVGNVSSQTLMAMSTMSARRIIDYNNNTFFLDASSASTLQSVVVDVLSANGAIVRSSASFVLPTTISQHLTVANTLTLGGAVVHSGDITVTQTSVIRFRVLSSGDIVSAKQLELSSGFIASNPDAVFVIRDGLNQYSTTGQNSLSMAIFHNDVYLLQSSLAVGSSRQMELQSSGYLSLAGNLRSTGPLTVGFKALQSSFSTSGASLILDSSQGFFYLTNEAASAWLNVNARDVRIARVVTGNNEIFTPVLYSQDPAFILDPTSVNSIHSLTMSSMGSSGGHLHLSAALHARSILDRSMGIFSLDPSRSTTVTTLVLRAGSLDRFPILSSLHDDTVLKVRDSNSGNHILSLENGTLVLQADGSMRTSGSMTSDGYTLLKSAEGLVFSSSTHRVFLTSETLFKLAGKSGQTADTLHQHSLFNSIPLTSFIRRDISNQISSAQTFTASGLGFYLQPETVTANTLLVQKNTDGATTLYITADGQFYTALLEGDGEGLRQIHGDSIIPLSLVHSDFATGTLLAQDFADASISGSKLQALTLSAEHFIAQTLTFREFANNSVQAVHFRTSSLGESKFATGAVQSLHLANRSVNQHLIASNTLLDSVFANQAVTEGHLVDASITSAELAPNSILLQNLTADSIDSSVVESLSLQTVDLATGSVSILEIMSQAITSAIVRDENVLRAKIATAAIDSSLLVSRTILSQDFEDQSITRIKIASATLTSREILDLSLINSNFQNQAITNVKLGPDSIRTRHVSDSAIYTPQILDDSIQTRNFVLHTIGSSEFLDLTLLNEDFVNNSLHPSHIASNSIEARHVRTKAITAIKITSAGIDNRYFQPYTFQGDRIQDGAIRTEHLSADAILSYHILSQTILAEDIQDGVLHSEKIADYGVARIDLATEGVGLHNVALDSILAHHFVSDSLLSTNINTGAITTDRVANLSISSDKIIDLSLLNDLFANNSAIDGKFANSSIGTVHVSDSSLLLSNFALAAVTAGKIADNSLVTANFADAYVFSVDIGNRQLTSSQLAENAVSEAQVSTGGFISRHFSPGIVATEDFVQKSLVNSSFAQGAVSGFNLEFSQIDARIMADGSILRRSLSGNLLSTRTLAPLTITSLQVAPHSLTSRVLDDHQLIEANFIADSLTRRVLAPQSIEGNLVLSYSVLGTRIASFSVDQERIATDSVENRHLKAGVVMSTHVLDGSVLENKIATSSLTRRVFAAQSIESQHLLSETLRADNFLTKTISTAKLVNSPILRERHIELDTLQAAKFTGPIPASAFAADSLSGSAFADGSIPEAQIADFSIDSQAVASLAITTAKFMAQTLGNDHFADQGISTASIGNGQILNANIATGIIQSLHIKDGSLGQLQLMTRSLDTTKFNTGAIWSFNVASATIATSNIAPLFVNGERFASGTISGSKVSTHAITERDLQGNGISGTRLAADAVNATHLHSRFFLDASAIASAGIATSHLGSGIILPSHFPQNSISAAKVGEVSGWAFANHSIGASKFAAGAVTGAKVLTGTIGDLDRPVYYTGPDQRIRLAYERNPASTTWITDASTPFMSRNFALAPVASPAQFVAFANDGFYTLQSVNMAAGTLSSEKSFGRFAKRSGHSALHMGGKIYVIGGYDADSNQCYSDVWESSNARDWTRIYNGGFYADGSTGGRCIHGAASAVYLNNLVLAGGCTNSAPFDSCVASNQVNYSPDGVNWNRADLVADSDPNRLAYASAAADITQMIVFGGLRNGSYSNTIYRGLALGSWSTPNYNGPIVSSRLFAGFNQNLNTDLLSFGAVTLSKVGLGAIAYSDLRNTADGSHELDLSAGDYHLSGGSAAVWQLDSIGGAFTVEAMIRPANLLGTKRILAVHDGTGELFNFGVFGNKLRLTASPFTVLDGNTNLTAGSWHHVALTRDGSDFRLFVNGTLQAGTISTPMSVISTQTMFIFGENLVANRFVGQVDELRIIKGTALYTSDFAAPAWLDGGRGGPKMQPLVSAAVGYSNGYFVVAGGLGSGNNPTDEIWFASEFNPSLWYRSAKVLPGDIYSATMHTVGSKLVLTQGSNQGSFFTSFTPPNLSDFSYGNAVPGNVHSHATVYDGSRTFIIGGVRDGATASTVLSSPNMISFTETPAITDVNSLHWISESPDVYSFLSKEGSDSYQIEYDGTAISRTAHTTAIRSMHRLDAANFVGVTAHNGQLVYATSANFSGHTTAGKSGQVYNHPRLHPSGSHIYAVNEVNASNHRLVRIPKNPGPVFGEEENLTPGFASQNITISGFEFDQSGDYIYLVGNVTGSEQLHRISVSGTGLTTLAATANAGVIVREGQPYNPYITTGAITTASIRDGSLTSDNLLAKTLSSADFGEGGITTDSFPAGSLTNIHFAVASLVREKWKTESIGVEKFGLQSISNVKLQDGILTTRVLIPQSFEGRNFADNTFSNAQILAQTLTLDLLRPNTFTGSVASSLTTSDLMDTSLEGNLFVNLGSSEIGALSLSSTKYTSRSFTNSQFADLSIGAEQVLSGSLSGNKLTTNQWQNLVLEASAIRSEHLSANSLVSADFANSSVQSANVAANSILSQHLMDNSLESDNLPASVVNLRTLADQSVTAVALAQDSIALAQMNSQIVTGGSISANTIDVSKMADASIRTTHVDGSSLSNSNIILANTISTRSLDIATISQGKLAASVPGDRLRTASFEGRAVTGVTFAQVANNAIEDYHLVSQTLVTANFANTSILSAKFAPLSIYSRHLADNSFSQTNFQNDSILNQRIADGAIDNTLVNNATVTVDRFAANSIHENAIEANNLTGNRLDTASILAVNFKDLGLVTADFAANAVSNADLANSVITDAALASQTIQSAKIADNTLNNSHFTGLADADFSNLTATQLQDGTFSGNVFRGDSILGHSFASNSIPNAKLANGAIQTANIVNITSAKVPDTNGSDITDAKISTVDPINGSKVTGLLGSQFTDGSIAGDRIQAGVLRDTDFANDAVAAADLADNNDLTGKISGTAALKDDIMVDGTITDASLSSELTGTHANKFANDAVTTAKLVASPNFGSFEVNDGTLTAAKLADATVDTFSAASITNAKFDETATNATSAKIAAGAVRGMHIGVGQITQGKLTGQLAHAKIPDDSMESNDFVAGTFTNATISDDTIPANRLKSQVILDDATFLPTNFDIDKFETVGSAQIANGIFTASHFDPILTATDLANLEGDRFTIPANATTLLANYSVTNADVVASPIVTSPEVARVNGRIGNANLAASTVTRNQMVADSITGAKFGDGIITSAKFDSLGGATTDPEGGAVIVPGDGGHTHSPYYFKRTQPTNYALINNGQFGRANFAYRIKSGSFTYATAHDTCRTDHATVCSLSQLAAMCDAGSRPTVFSGTPVIRKSNVNGNNVSSMTYPLVQFAAGCEALSTVNTMYTVGDILQPVDITDTLNGITETLFFDNRWFYKINNGIYHTPNADGRITGSPGASFADGGVKTTLHVTKHNSRLLSFSQINNGVIYKYNTGTDVFDSFLTGLGYIIEIDSFAVNEATVFARKNNSNNDNTLRIVNANTGTTLAADYDFGTGKTIRAMAVRSPQQLSGGYQVIVVFYDGGDTKVQLMDYVSSWSTSFGGGEWTAYSGDLSRDLIVTGDRNFFIVKSDGKVNRYLYPSSNYNAGLPTATADWFNVAGQTVVKGVFEVKGATRRMFFLTAEGRLYYRDVDNVGTPTGSWAYYTINKPAAFSFTTANSSIRVISTSDFSRIIVTGPDKHIFELNQGTISDVACCRQGLN